MGFSFQKARVQVRKTVHNTFSVQAFYRNNDVDIPVELTVRYHTKLALQGGPNDTEGYAQYYENIDRVIFNVDELSEKSVVLQRTGVLWIPGYGDGVVYDPSTQESGPSNGSVAFELDVAEPINDPAYVIWNVTKL